MGNAMHECIKVFEAALTKLTCLHSESGKGPVGLCRPWIIIVWISPSGVTDLVKLNSSCSVHPDPVINDNGPNYGFRMKSHIINANHSNCPSIAGRLMQEVNLCVCV